MFIKRTTKRVKGKVYHSHLLVESVATPRGPRHRVVCSLGNLDPGPPEQWLGLARRIESALKGQAMLLPEQAVEAVVEKVRVAPVGEGQPQRAVNGPETVRVLVDEVATQHAREAGPVHTGHRMWLKLGLDEILRGVGLSKRTRWLTELMTMNRLIQPSSELQMPDWARRTALGDILGTDLSRLRENSLYRNLDRLHPKRVEIEGGLSERERSLFNLDDDIYLYDLTSTYFEGLCLANPQAQRGYSRDKRPDCKQVVVGLVIGKEGFPKAHEVFDGNRTDKTTVEEMLCALEKRTGKQEGKTVVVDRGMAFDDNLQQIRSHGYHYIVASRQGERDEYLDEFEDTAGWEEIIRTPSPRNPCQKKSKVSIKLKQTENELHVLCRSEGREEKDRAIREKHEERLRKDLKKLQHRISAGRLVKESRIHQAIGRLKERYPRVSRYYDIDYNADSKQLSSEENNEKKQKAALLDGAYLLKTDRKDMTQEDIWRTYILLTRIESAFRSMKSPLMERPIFHHLEHRVQTHIFLCVLAYHLLVAIENTFLAQGIHTSWGTLRGVLSTHQVTTVVLPTPDGRVLRIRKGTTPEPEHAEIYRILGIPGEVMRPVKTWGKREVSTSTIVTENLSGP